MTFVPKYSSPCDLSQRMPGAIAELLQADSDLKKRFREETITDLVVASIKALPVDGLIVAVPYEKVTGSDFDLAIISADREDAIQFRLQAKRLMPHSSNWKMSSYRELAHPHNSGGQAATLIRSSASEKIPTIPLYAFYNPQGVVDESESSVAGFELASGVDVSHIIQEMVKAKPKRLPYKRVSYLQSLFFPLSKLLCEPFTGETSQDIRPSVPHPSVFRRLVEDAMYSRSFARFEEPVHRLALPDSDGFLSQTKTLSLTEYPTALPEVREYRSNALPLYLDRILDRASGSLVVEAPIKRPKIILRSK